MKLDERLLNIQPYATLKGEYPIRLDVNESFLNLPDRIVAKFKNEIEGLSFNRYPDPYAQSLCNAFSGYYGVNSANVTAGNGSDELISLIIEAFLADNDKIMTLTPDFSMYAFYTFVRRGRVVSYAKADGYEVDLKGVLALANIEKPKILIFSNPCNPTGGIISKENILFLAQNLGCLIVVDEAYMDFADQSILSHINELDNVIVLRTLSKLGAAAVARVGFAVANPRLTKILKSVKSVYNVNGLSQALARLVYLDKDFLVNSRDEILKSKNYLYNELLKLGDIFKVYPSFTNFIYIKCPKADEIYNALLKKGIAIRCFKNRLRINAGSDFENKSLIDALKEIVV